MTLDHFRTRDAKTRIGFLVIQLENFPQLVPTGKRRARSDASFEAETFQPNICICAWLINTPPEPIISWRLQCALKNQHHIVSNFLWWFLDFYHAWNEMNTPTEGNLKFELDSKEMADKLSRVTPDFVLPSSKEEDSFLWRCENQERHFEPKVFSEHRFGICNNGYWIHEVEHLHSNSMALIAQSSTPSCHLKTLVKFLPRAYHPIRYIKTNYNSPASQWAVVLENTSWLFPTNRGEPGGCLAKQTSTGEFSNTLIATTWKRFTVER